MSRFKVAGDPLHLRFPRVSGDEPIYLGTAGFASLFSPRERG